MHKQVPCFDCPHVSTSEAVMDLDEMDEFERLAQEGIVHECHNNRSVDCSGQFLGDFAVIKEI